MIVSLKLLMVKEIQINFATLPSFEGYFLYVCLGHVVLEVMRMFGMIVGTGLPSLERYC